jgi:hypothetical protein
MRMKKSFTRWHKINSSFEADRIHAGVELAKMKLKLQARGSFAIRGYSANRGEPQPLEIMDIEDPPYIGDITTTSINLRTIASTQCKLQTIELLPLIRVLLYLAMPLVFRLIASEGICRPGNSP